MSKLYPLRITPIYKTSIWGGRKIADFLNRELPDGNHFAESWDVSNHPAGQSVISNGPLKGQLLQDVFESERSALLGPHSGENFTRFPLMVKFLDANKQLSVQVHPNEEYVAKNDLTDAGKAEAWVILDVIPGSQMSLGFKEPITPEKVANALESNSLEDLLFHCEPNPGECYFLPPGTVHSLGAGIFLYEVQQCSNLTFRLYDWNRTDEYGRRRELHVKEALETLRPENWNSEPIVPRLVRQGRELLIDAEPFCLERLTFTAEKPSHRLDCSKSCRVLTVISGQLTVPGLEEALQKGDSVILPSELGRVTLKSKDAVVLDAFLPQKTGKPKPKTPKLRRTKS
ncbi:MAG: class I mannose-6-phosphate isomerase [Thermoguttaceae bacterium]|nr:class I mannose-6-phosphate isomerase [Thermoguttaceae bacterium]